MISNIPIYIDLDGVLLDWEGRVKEIFEGMELADIPTKEIWIRIAQFNNAVQPFFETLDKMPDADRLVSHITTNFSNVKFLTATGNTPKDAGEQKRRSCAIKWPDIECITVRKSSDKAQYAHQSILIDDRSKSIDPWVESGGCGILHTSADRTIEILTEFFSEYNENIFGKRYE